MSVAFSAALLDITAEEEEEQSREHKRMKTRRVHSHMTQEKQWQSNGLQQMPPPPLSLSLHSFLSFPVYFDVQNSPDP